MMRGKLAAVVAAVLGGSLLQVSPAQAVVSLTGVTVTNPRVVLNGDTGCGSRAKVTTKVQDPLGDADELLGVSAHVTGPAGEFADVLLFPRYAGRSGSYETFLDSIFVCGSHPPGRHRMTTEMEWRDGSANAARVANRTTYFYVQRPTSLAYNVSPEAPRQGTTLTHSGRLMFDPVRRGGMYGPSGVPLAISFKKAGTTRYVTQGYVTTTRNGYFTRKLVARYDGMWRVSYAGTSAQQAQNGFDYINVR